MALERTTGTLVITGHSASSNFVTLAYSRTGAALWTNFYSGPIAYNQPRAITVDEDVNTYVCGNSTGAGGQVDTATVAYSATGVGLWTNRYSLSMAGFPVAHPSGLRVGPGVVYLAGDVTATAYGRSRAFVLAYTRGGQPLWTNYYNAPPSYTETLKSLAVDQEGTVYVAGACDALGVTADWFTIAYSSKGEGLWTNRYNGPADGNDCATEVAVRDGQVYVAGYSEGIATGWDINLICYSTGGQGLWTNRYDGPRHGRDAPLAMTVDAQGNVFIAVDSDNYIAIAYSKLGVPLWTSVLLPGIPSDMAVDRVGNVVIAGYAYMPNGHTAYLTTAYSAMGVGLWTNFFQGEVQAGDQAWGRDCLAIGADGGICVSGISAGLHEGQINEDVGALKYMPVPDIRLTSISRQPNATIRLEIAAPSNTPYGVEASSDLRNWLRLTNFPPLPVSSIDYTDALAPGFAQRFYRAVWSP